MSARRWFAVCLCALYMTLCHGLPLVKRDPASGATSGPFNLSAEGWVLGIVAILSGLYFCFFGRRFFKITMFATGFWFFSNIVYVAIAQHNLSDTATLVIAIIVGVICGGLLACCWHIGLYFLGGLAGYSFALWILSFKAGGSISSGTGRTIFIIVLITIGVILMFFLEDWMVILSTSFVGAYLFMFGVDMFIQKGFAQATASFLGGNFSAYDNVSTAVYVMLAVTVVLFALGVWVQWRYHTGRHFRSGAMSPYGYGTRWGRKSGYVPPAYQL